MGVGVEAVSVAVVVPWSDTGCVYRRRNWEWVRGRLAERYPEFEVVVGESSPGPFNRAEAVLDGVSRTDAEVLVVYDADVWLAGDLSDPVGRVSQSGGWSVPHWHLRRLDEAATELVLGGEEPGPDLGLSERPYKGQATGTLVVLERSLLWAVPPDVRFVGWGQEDEAWAAALTLLAGPPARGGVDLYHLWHPPQARMNRAEGSVEGVALRSRYDRVARDRRGMRALLDESRGGWRDGWGR